MNNFEYFCPTRLVFGKGSIARLPDFVDKKQKILMIYGGGSIKKNGVYQQVKEALRDYRLIEFSGLEPNPRYETCMRAVDVIKKNNVDFLLSVGGGSVLDGVKFIAAAAKYTGEDPYDILTKGAKIKEALPFGDVITLPATGSEMNSNAVISRESTNEKLLFSSEKVFPQFSIIDPETTFSLPLKQSINGVVDTFVHVMELYCTYDVNTPLQDSWALGLLKTLTQEAPKIIENPHDYEARANIFWCATCGLNYWIALGTVQDWSTHMIGHELTAFYGIDHAQSLAVVLPRLLIYQENGKRGKLAKLGRFVFDIKEPDDKKAARKTIEAIETFFNMIGMDTKLSGYHINAREAAGKIKERFEKRNVAFGEHHNINASAAYDIVKSC